MTQKTSQFELNFEAGLTVQFPDFSDILLAVANSGSPPAKVIAMDLDISPSMFSRMIGDDETVQFPARRLDELIQVTEGYRIIYWLIEKFLQDADEQAKQALREIPAAVERLTRLAELAELAVPTEDEPKLKAAQ